MEPSYSHSSQDSMTTTTTNNNTFYPDLDIPLSQSPIDSFYDYEFSTPPTSQYPFPDMDLDMYPVTTNTSYALPIPCPQPPQYYNPSPFGSLTSIPSTSSSPSSLSSSSPLSPPPLQWSLGDESTIPRFSLAPPEPSPKYAHFTLLSKNQHHHRITYLTKPDQNPSHAHAAGHSPVPPIWNAIRPVCTSQCFKTVRWQSARGKIVTGFPVGTIWSSICARITICTFPRGGRSGLVRGVRGRVATALPVPSYYY